VLNSTEEDGVADEEIVIHRLLRRAAKTRRRRLPPEVPVGRETDPNREFSALDDISVRLWFLCSLSLFVIVYVIWVRITSY
jgi:hypothetical protein